MTPADTVPAAACVYSVRSLGALPRRFNDAWHLIGQDGGQSIPAGGKTLLVFSDTLLAARTPQHPRAPVPSAFAAFAGREGVFLANTAGLAMGSDLRDAWARVEYFQDDSGFPREVLPAGWRERAQQVRFWPEHGIFLDGLVYLFYLGVQTTDPTSIWGFRPAGSGVAVLDPGTGVCERIIQSSEWRLWHSTHDDFHFGVQVLLHEDHVYVFGSARKGLFSYALLARVAPGRIGDPGAYEYLSGDDSWSPHLGSALDLGPAGADFSVSFNPYLNCYLMLYVDGYDKTLVMRTADRLWGPYSPPQPIIGVPHEPATELVYLGFEHPDFRRDEGRTIYVSYCQPRFTNNRLLMLKFR
jgi:hypothetical protein